MKTRTKVTGTQRSQVGLAGKSKRLRETDTPSPKGRSLSGRVSETEAIYRTSRPKVVENALLPGIEPFETTFSKNDITYSLETGFRRYGLEGEDVFLAVAARCVQESNIRCNGFDFFQYERGLHVLDLVTHDRQLNSLLVHVCGDREAALELPVYYQYFVGRRFREGSGKFFTPRPVARSMSKLLPIDGGTVICDPTCGGGTFLSEAAKLLHGTPCELVGNDVDRTLVGLTEVVLALTSTGSQKRRLFCENVYDSGQFHASYSGRVDCILANPPFSLPLEKVGLQSPLFSMGYRNSDAVFLDVCMDLLKAGGHLVCLMPHSVVVNADYAELRARVERDWDLCGIITLPEGVFYLTASTTTRADIIHLRKKVARQAANAKVYFANAPTVGVVLNSRDTEPSANALEEVAVAVHTRGCVAKVKD